MRRIVFVVVCWVGIVLSACAASVEPTAAPTGDVKPTPVVTIRTGLPDLIVAAQTSLAPPLCLGAHSRPGILVTVTNRGDAHSGAFVVAVSGVWQAVEDGVPAGESIRLWFDLAAMPTPWVEVDVSVDAADMVAEADEDNNRVTALVMTLTPPLPCASPTPVPTGTPLP